MQDSLADGYQRQVQTNFSPSLWQNMEEGVSSEILETIYKPAWCHNLENRKSQKTLFHIFHVFNF
jgi:hypothetical protein